MNFNILIPLIVFSNLIHSTKAQNFAILPLKPAFETNVGQYENEIFYQINTTKGNIKFCKNKVVFTYVRPYEVTIGKEGIASQIGIESLVTGQTWEMIFDSSLNTIPKAEGNSLSNFRFFGNGSTNGKIIERFKKIRYSNAFQKTDVLFYLDEQSGLFKYDIILKPGASLKSIQIFYTGIESLLIDSNAELAITTSAGIFKESKPIAYWGRNQSVIDIAYHISNNSVNYICEHLTHELLKDTLIIDPAFLTWSSLFYGETKEKLPNSNGRFVNNTVTGFEMDDEGNLYILGNTNMDYKQITKNFDSASNRDYLAQLDFFLCKLNSKGDSIVYFNMVGTNGNDRSFSLEINKQNESLICGHTDRGSDFPTTKDAFNRTTGGSFVLSFSGNGDSILFSTFYSNNSLITKALFNSQKEILVVGIADNAFLPITKNALQPNFGGNYSDAFIAKFSRDGKTLNYASYLGGSHDELITDGLINSKGEIIVVGKTKSYDFPTKSTNTDFNIFRGQSMGFITKFDSSFSKIEFSNLIGGSGFDYLESIAINEDGDIFASGVSNSTDFPVSIYPKAFQPQNKGLFDLVIVRLSADGKYIKNSTYLGGSHSDYSLGYYENVTQVGLNEKGEVWLIGQSASADFPVTSDAYQKNNDTLGWLKSDITISKLSPNLDKLLYSSYFGGKYGELLHTNSIKRQGCITHILFGGSTFSKDYHTTAGSLIPNPPKDSIYDSPNYLDQHRIGFATRFSDTLKLEKTSFESSTRLRCNQFLEILDGLNVGASRRWSTNDSGRYLLVDKPGTYWLQATYGCDTLRDTVTILQQFGPNSVLPKDTFICDNNPILLSAENDSINASFLWNTLDTSSRINIYKSGTFWVNVLTPNCGSITDTICVHYIKAPDLQFPNDTFICNQDSIVLRVDQNNFETAIWQDSIHATDWVVRKTGLYHIKSSNMCGIDSATLQVYFLKNPVPFNFFKDTTICQGTEFVAKTGSPDNYENYLWVNTITQKTVSSDDTFRINQSGKFIVYNSNICGSKADSFKVNYLTLPVIQLDSIYTPCQGNDLSLSVGKSDNNEKYLWSNNATTASSLFQQSGNQWVQITNSCGSDFHYFTISYTSKPNALFNNSDVCEGQIFQFKPIGYGANSYFWRMGDGTVSSDSAPLHQYPATGQARTFLVSLKAFASADCADSITLPVNVKVTPAPDFIWYAQGKALFFTPLVAGSAYKWFFGDGDSSALDKPVHSYTADSGSYNVCLHLTNAENCTGITCKNIQFNVGVKELNASFMLYPNPADNAIAISLNKPVNKAFISIKTILGNCLITTPVYGTETTIDISGLKPGMYWLELVSENLAGNRIVIKK